jgi:hypothetical protein
MKSNIDLFVETLSTLLASADVTDFEQIITEFNSRAKFTLENLLKPFAHAVLADELKQKEPEQEEETYSVGDYFYIELVGYFYIELVGLQEVYRLTDDRGTNVYLQKGHDDYYQWASSTFNHAVNNMKKITQKEFADIANHTSGFTKITKAEAEQIVGHALD